MPLSRSPSDRFVLNQTIVIGARSLLCYYGAIFMVNLHSEESVKPSQVLGKKQNSELESIISPFLS